MNYELDEVDKRILYRLVEDCRNVTSLDISDEVGVSPGTIRNRMKQLEEKEVINGYHASIDYERIGNKIVNVFKCSSSARNRSVLAKKALSIPGVISVRELMTGEQDLHIVGVGKDTADISRIEVALENFGIEVNEEDLLKEEYYQPYHSFGPKERKIEPIINLRRIVGDAEVVDITIQKNVSVEEKNLAEINRLGLLPENTLIIAIERGDKIITPRGDTKIKVGDIVTLFSPDELSNQKLEAFTEESG